MGQSRESAPWNTLPELGDELDLTKALVADARIVRAVLPVIRRVFAETRECWDGARLGMCLKVATRVLRLLDEAVEAESPGDEAENQRLDARAECLARMIYSELAAPDVVTN